MTYPTITPKLTLDFANSRQLDPRITFSRSSTATYLHPDTGLITTAPSGVARFEKEGFLIEESRTNLIPQSEDLSTTWFNGAATLDSAVVDPAGNTGTVYYLPASAERLIQWNGGGASEVFVSVFIKQNAGETSTHVLQVWQSGTFLGSVSCPLTGSFAPTGNYSDGTRTEYPNGWFKFTFKATGPGTFGTGCRLDTEQSTNYTWGFQIEAGSFPTSYIPTAGSTVTRAADLASITGTNFSSWYNTSEGTIILRTPKILPSTGNKYYYAIGPSGGERIATFQPNNSSFRAAILSSGATFSGQISNPDEPIKSALSFNGSGASWAVNGSIVNTSTTITPPATAAELSFSTRSTGAVVQDPKTKFHLTGFIYYDRRVSDAELQSLTS